MANADILKPEERANIRKYFAQPLYQLDWQAALEHGTFKLEHVLVSDDNISIIDWEWCKAGTGEMDLARFFLS
ncbi:MAG: hypothetical protein ACE5FT_01015 [Candidatus Nanoarchaeia archaeon]